MRSVRGLVIGLMLVSSASVSWGKLMAALKAIAPMARARASIRSRMAMFMKVISQVVREWAWANTRLRMAMFMKVNS